MINDQAPITKEKTITDNQISITKGEGNGVFRLINCILVIGNSFFRGFRLINCNLVIGYCLLRGI